jgi:MFS transporter, FHS family, glucose/mannose:H+ symporter
LTSYWCFVVLGASATLLGPALLPILSDFKISPSGAGPLFLANSTGYLLAVLFGGPAGDYWERRVVLRVGAAFFSAGMAAVFIAPVWALAILAFWLMGLGSGIVDSGTNALVNDTAPVDNRPREQSLLHASFGFGALLGPLIIGAFLDLHFGWRPAYAVTAVGALVLIPMFSRLKLPRRPKSHPTVSVGSVVRLATTPFVLVLALMIGSYVGAEMLLGDWSATYLQRIHHLDKVTAAASVSLYWGGIMVGRLLSALATRWFTGRSLLVATCGLSLVATLALVAAPTAAIALVALALCGIGHAAVFPLVMAVGGEVFPEVSGSIAGLLIGAAAIFGASVPWLGGVLVQYSDARMAVALAIPATVIMIVVSVVLLRYRPATAMALPSLLPA